MARVSKLSSTEGETTMCFLCSLIPATVFGVLGYFVLFASAGVAGTMQTFGQVLAIWVFIVALCFPICGAYVTLSGMCPMEKMMQQWKTPSEKQP
jgi:ABC-type transporter lipoprotein component MlaA